jgi:hypothetical protein
MSKKKKKDLKKLCVRVFCFALALLMVFGMAYYTISFLL